MNFEVTDPLEQLKFNLLGHSLEINEYKKQNKFIPIENYENILNGYLSIVNSYLDSQEWHEEFKTRVGNLMGVKF